MCFLNLHISKLKNFTRNFSSIVCKILLQNINKRGTFSIDHSLVELQQDSRSLTKCSSTIASSQLIRSGLFCLFSSNNNVHFVNTFRKHCELYETIKNAEQNLLIVTYKIGDYNYNNLIFGKIVEFIRHII